MSSTRNDLLEDILTAVEGGTGAGVQSVTGGAVDNADPAKPIVNTPKVGVIRLTLTNNTTVPTTVTQVLYNIANEDDSNGFFEYDPVDDAVTLIIAGIYQITVSSNVLKAGGGDQGSYRFGVGRNGAEPQKGAWRSFKPSEINNVDETTAEFNGQLPSSGGDKIKFYHAETGSGSLSLFDSIYSFPSSVVITYIGPV